MSTRRPSRLDPQLHFGQVPGNIPAGERDAAREFPSLFHVENRALGEWDHLQQLLAVDERLALRLDLHTVAFIRLRIS